MSRTLRMTVSFVAAVVVETVCVWVLTRVGLDAAIALPAAFAAGYVAWCATRGAPPAADLPFGSRLRANLAVALAALLLVEAMVYLCMGLMGLGLMATNAAALVALACWVTLGGYLVTRDAGGS
jgi:hypothetical protein